MNKKYEAIRWAEGIFVGMLSDEELELFEEAVKEGIAVRSYEGGAGFFGLAKVRFK